MTKATKAKLDALSAKVSTQVRDEEAQGAKLKLVLVAVAGAVLLVVFMMIRKRRR